MGMYEERMEICNKCPFVLGRKVPICSRCGCLLKIKARFEIFDCPEGKWPRKEGEHKPSVDTSNITEETHKCKTCPK